MCVEKRFLFDIIMFYCHVTTQRNLLYFLRAWLENLTLGLRDLQKFINFRLRPQTHAEASSLVPLETSVLQTP